MVPAIVPSPGPLGSGPKVLFAAVVEPFAFFGGTGSRFGGKYMPLYLVIHGTKYAWPPDSHCMSLQAKLRTTGQPYQSLTVCAFPPGEGVADCADKAHGTMARTMPNLGALFYEHVRQEPAKERGLRFATGAVRKIAFRSSAGVLAAYRGAWQKPLASEAQFGLTGASRIPVRIGCDYPSSRGRSAIGR